MARKKRRSREEQHQDFLNDMFADVGDDGKSEEIDYDDWGRNDDGSDRDD